MIREIEYYKKEIARYLSQIKKLKKEIKIFRKLECEVIVREHEIIMIEYAIEYYRQRIKRIVSQVPV